MPNTYYLQGQKAAAQNYGIKDEMMSGGFGLIPDVGRDVGRDLQRVGRDVRHAVAGVPTDPKAVEAFAQSRLPSHTMTMAPPKLRMGAMIKDPQMQAALKAQGFR